MVVLKVLGAQLSPSTNAGWQALVLERASLLEMET